MNKLKKYLSQILWKTKYLKDRIYMKIFHLKTQKKGLDLVSEILPENNGLDPKKVKRCTHSNTPYLRKTLRLLNISSQDSIIDIGCSKGAALICMYEFPFKQIDGIEISTNLAKIAKDNIAKLSIKNIKIYNINALDYSNYNQNNIFYFYNSLFPEALKKVLENILNYAKDEELVFIYNNPAYAYIFDDLHLYLIHNLKGNWNHRIYIYSNIKNPARFKSSNPFSKNNL